MSAPNQCQRPLAQALAPAAQATLERDPLALADMFNEATDGVTVVPSVEQEVLSLEGITTAPRGRAGWRTP